MDKPQRHGPRRGTSSGLGRDRYWVLDPFPKAPCRYYLKGLRPNVGIIYRVRAPGFGSILDVRAIHGVGLISSRESSRLSPQNPEAPLRKCPHLYPEHPCNLELGYMVPNFRHTYRVDGGSTYLRICCGSECWLMTWLRDFSEGVYALDAKQDAAMQQNPA